MTDEKGPDEKIICVPLATRPGCADLRHPRRPGRSCGTRSSTSSRSTRISRRRRPRRAGSATGPKASPRSRPREPGSAPAERPLDRANPAPAPRPPRTGKADRTEAEPADEATGASSTHGPSRPRETDAAAEPFAGPRSFGPTTVCVCPGGAKVATGYQVVIFHVPPIFCASARNDQAHQLRIRGLQQDVEPDVAGIRVVDDPAVEARALRRVALHRGVALQPLAVARRSRDPGDQLTSRASGPSGRRRRERTRRAVCRSRRGRASPASARPRRATAPGRARAT